MDNYMQRFANKFIEFANRQDKSKQEPLNAHIGLSMHYIHSREYAIIPVNQDKLFQFSFYNWANAHQLQILSMSDGLAGMIMRNGSLAYISPLSLRETIARLPVDDKLATLVKEAKTARIIDKHDLEIWEYAFQDYLTK